MRPKHVLTFGLDLLLPPCCSICRTRLSAPGLCGSCWSGFEPVTDPLCQACGRPLPYAMPTDLCGRCHAEPPVVTPLRAICRYNEVARRLLVPFKHADRLDILPLLQRMMAARFAEMTAHDPLVIPVPLHRWRFFTRRYNQSAELARILCRAQNKPYLYQPDLLVRKRHTSSMGHLRRADRQANVKGAFAVRPAGRQTAAGRDILLIDDVMTTGATLESCAKSLRDQTDCRAVGALVVARVF